MSQSPRSGARKEIVFADTLSVLLPLEEQVYLLKACLQPGNLGMRAWQIWQEKVGDVLAGLQSKDQGGRSLIPLLARALRNNQIEIDPKVRSHLHRVVLYEELRALVYQQILRQIVTVLSVGGIDYLALKGAMLSATVYVDWSLRHNHDIDLLLHQEDLKKAMTLLEEHSFSRTSDSNRLHASSIKLVHHSGLSVELHGRLFRIPYYRAPLHQIWTRKTPANINGTALNTLAPADALMHVCGQAACSRSRDSLLWVCDAWHLLQSGKVEWDISLATALASRLELPLAIQFDFLKNEMQAPIPEDVLNRLISAAQMSPRLAQEAALLGARLGRNGSIRNVLRQAPAWKTKATLLIWMLLPSPDAMRWTEDVRSVWRLPLLYIARPIRFVMRHLLLCARLLLQRLKLHRYRSIL
ncbi:MAG: nucleotidyltransferase family protein [Anaerolineales bacterium]